MTTENATTLLRVRKAVPYLVAAACVVVLVAALRASASILNPVLFATFLALLVQPLTEWLEERARFPSGLAITLVVLATVLAMVAVVGFMVVSMQEVVAAAPEYADKLAEQIRALNTFLKDQGLEQIDIASLPEQVLRSPEFGSALLSISQSTAGALGNVALTLFIFAFTVGGVARLDARLERGDEPNTVLARRFTAFSTSIRRYMAIRAVLGVVAAVLNYVLLLLLGVDFALLWGVLSFVLSFVPNIGYTLSVIPPVLIALVDGGWQQGVFVYLGYTVINNVVDNVVGPRYIGQQMQMSALLSFLSVIFWAWVLGPTGAILAVPLTVLVRELVSPVPAPTAPAPVDPPGSVNRPEEKTTSTSPDAADRQDE